MTQIFGAAAICFLLLFAPHVQATTIGPFDVDIWSGDWSTHTMGSVPLSQGDVIGALHTNIYAYDQGWGGENGNWTHAFVQLTVNGANAWWVQVAGAVHQRAWYDFTADATQLGDLYVAINAIDWTTNPTVSLDLDANIQAYSGWEGHFHSATEDFTITPEPGSVVLLGCGLVGLAVVRRRKQAR